MTSHQSLDAVGAEAAVLNPVEHPAQHAGSVRHRLLVPDLASGGFEVGGVGALVEGGHLEGAPGAGGGLLEDQGDVAADQALGLLAGLLVRLELGGKVQQLGPFGGVKSDSLTKWRPLRLIMAPCALVRKHTSFQPRGAKRRMSRRGVPWQG